MARRRNCSWRILECSKPLNRKKVRHASAHTACAAGRYYLRRLLLLAEQARPGCRGKEEPGEPEARLPADGNGGLCRRAAGAGRRRRRGRPGLVRHHRLGACRHLRQHRDVLPRDRARRALDRRSRDPADARGGLVLVRWLCRRRRRDRGARRVRLLRRHHRPAHRPHDHGVLGLSLAHPPPLGTTVPLGVAIALLGPIFAVWDQPWVYAIAIATAASAMAASIPLRSTLLLTAGTLALFGYLTAAVVRDLRASIGLPATLAICGVLLLALAVAMARVRRGVRPKDAALPETAPGTGAV